MRKLGEKENTYISNMLQEWDMVWKLGAEKWIRIEEWE